MAAADVGAERRRRGAGGIARFAPAAQQQPRPVHLPRHGNGNVARHRRADGRRRQRRERRVALRFVIEPDGAAALRVDDVGLRQRGAVGEPIQDRRRRGRSPTDSRSSRNSSKKRPVAPSAKCTVVDERRRRRTRRAGAIELRRRRDVHRLLGDDRHRRGDRGAQGRRLQFGEIHQAHGQPALGRDGDAAW